MTGLGIGIALAPAAALLFYIYQKDRYDREPPALLFKLLIFGALIVVPVYFTETFLMFFNIFGSTTLSAAYKSFIVAGLTEEYFKRLVVLKTAYKNKSYNEKLDGIVYCVYSSLGFAAVENLMYILIGNNNYLYTGVSRGIFAVPAHMLFGVTMGYYMSLSKFSSSPHEQKKYYFKSLYIPVLMHGIYDFIILSGFNYLIILFIAFVLYMWRVNLKKLNEYVNDSRIRYENQYRD